MAQVGAGIISASTPGKIYAAYLPSEGNASVRIGIAVGQLFIYSIQNLLIYNCLKKPFCFLLLIVSNLISFSTFAQVGIGTQTPDASAMLDVQSTVKGILVPRMTSAQRLAIPSGAPNGLLVFDTDNNSFWFFKSPTWMQITAAVGFAATPTSGKTIAD